MKKFTILFALIGFSCLAWSQTDDPPRNYSLQHEVGFNATPLIASLFSQTIEEDGAKLSFIYKYHPSTKGAIRLGIGGNFVDNTQVINQAEERNTNIIQGNVRLGYEFRKALGENWRTLFGVDALVNYQDRSTTFDSSFDLVTTTTKETRYGGSPFFGIEYKLNKHIRISTELSFSYSISQTEKVDLFQQFPDFNETIKSNDSGFRFENPAAIYLTVRL